MSEDLFALDIGTRTVVGLVYRPLETGIKIRSFEIKEHHMRSMYDGQIHDIDQVTEVVRTVKETLEKRLGIQLTKAYLAAAGRSLETETVYLETDINSTSRIDPEEIHALEMEAVNLAEDKLKSGLSEKTDTFKYHCVGHSVVRYTLDGAQISNLVGQKGAKMGVQVIATFLPQVVIDGLEGVMEQVELEVANITLEPIAAINIAIPREIRMLNLALVDIGAGTSDIAITNEGTVVAYQMVPTAGDEITDKICKNLLVDFHTGEKLKFALSSDRKKVTYKDVLGNKQEITTKELSHSLAGEVSNLAGEISRTILEVNDGPPGAVFCVGGGSELPGLEDQLAASLGLSKEKVAVKGYDGLHGIKNIRKGLQGPKGITPLGIAFTSVLNRTYGFIDVTVNGKLTRLFDRKGAKVADALVAARYPVKNLISKPGQGVTIWLNEKKLFFNSLEGSSAQVLVNDQTASLESDIKTRDAIQVIPASSGPPRKVKLSEVMQESPDYYFYLDNKKVPFPVDVFVNGEWVDYLNEKDRIVPNHAKVEVVPVRQVAKVMQALEIDAQLFCICDQNRNRLSPDQDIPEEGETFITAIPGKKDAHTAPKALNVTVNGEELIIPGNKAPKFMDIFQKVDFNTSSKKGELVVTINGEPAGFQDPIKEGDHLMIYWTEEGPLKLPLLDA